jgi:hypothetical protein
MPLSSTAGMAFDHTHALTPDSISVLVNHSRRRVYLVRQPHQKTGPHC